MNTTHFQQHFLFRIVAWLGASVLCVASALGFVLLAAEIGIKNSPRIQQALLARIQDSLPVPVQAADMELVFFPFPLVRASGVEIHLPRTGLVTAKELEIRPSFEHLLLGRLSLAEAVVTGPRVDLDISAPEQDLGQEKMQAVIQKVSSALPQGAELGIVSGTLGLCFPKGKQVLFTRVFARLAHAETITLDLQTRGDLAHSLHLFAEIPANQDQIQGTAQIEGLQADRVLSLLGPPELPLCFQSGFVTINSSFTVHNDLRLNAHLDLTAENLRVSTQHSTRDISGLAVESTLQLQASSLYADIHDARLRDPQISLTGQIGADFEHPWLQLGVQGRDLIVPPVAGICMDLFPKSKFLNKLFGVIRAGRVPDLHISTHGSNTEELKRELLIQGRMEEGTLHIPKLDLTLREADGYAWVKEKILYGSGISARMDRARGWEGSFRFGLEDREDRPFALSMQVSGPVEHIPAILHKTVKDQAFIRELQGLSDIHGRARGELDLTKTPQGLNIDILAREFTINGRHQRLPWSVTAKGTNLRITNRRLTVESAQTELGSSRLELSDAALTWKDEPALDIRGMHGRLDLGSFWPWIQDLSGELAPNNALSRLNLLGRADVSEASLNLPLSSPRKRRLEFRAQVHNVRVDHPVLSQPADLTSGHIVWGPQRSAVRNLSLSFLDGQAEIDAVLPGLPVDWKTPGLDLEFDGRFGPHSARLIQRLAGVPSPFQVQGPLSIDQGRFQHQAGGTFALRARLGFGSGLGAALDVLWGADQIELREFSIQDHDLRGTLSGSRTGPWIQASLAGRIRPAALERIFDQPWITGTQGMISGDLQARLNTSSWGLDQVRGGIQITETGLKPEGIPELTLHRLRLQAESQASLRIDDASLAWDGHEIAVQGTMQGTDAKKTVLDLNIQAEEADWSWVTSRFSSLASRFSSDEDHGLPAVQGRVTTRVETFRYHNRIISPLHLTWNLQPNAPLTVRIHEQSALCGISVPGKITLPQEEIGFTVAPSCQQQPLTPILECLTGSSRELATGTLDLRGHLGGTAPDAQDLASHLHGELNIKVTDGRLLRYSILARVLEVINSTEIFFGSLPDLENEGIRFASLQASARMQGSRIKVDHGLVDGHSLEMGFSGTVDLGQETVDIVVLVAPLKTLDRLIKKIPVISGLTRGNLVTIPVRVTGSWQNPKVIPLSPQAVSKELVDLMHRTLKLPLKIFQPFTDEHNEDKKALGE